MKKFILHHAPREIYSNINPLTFNSYKLLVAYAMVEAEIGNVYLISIFDYVFVSEDIAAIFSFYSTFDNRKLINDSIDVFFQEYSSYEDAYKVALDMMEISGLCYN
jgi:hypothetical protein